VKHCIVVMKVAIWLRGATTAGVCLNMTHQQAGQKTAAWSRKRDDVTSAILISVIACLVLAISILCTLN
jgi:hypothetical protein